MDSWMNDERLDITRKYVHDMINSFVEDPKGTNYHIEYNPPYMMINSPDLQHLLVKSCNDDKYIVKYGGSGATLSPRGGEASPRSLGGLAGQSGARKSPREAEGFPRSLAGEANLPRNIAELRAFNENIYDIEGHRVMTLGGDIIIIDIDGVAFDQLECVSGKRLPPK